MRALLLSCLLPFAASVAAATASSTPAFDPDQDPVAFKCYMCTQDEMRDVALDKGHGIHYVYDFHAPSISGFDVTLIGGKLIANHFNVEPWMQRQFDSLVSSYGSDGLLAYYHDIRILAAGGDHTRAGMEVLYGHHLSLLNPDHQIELEKVLRYLHARLPEFLLPDDPSGRLLRLGYMQADSVKAKVRFDGMRGYANFIFDYQTRQWRYVDSTVGSLDGDYVQNSPEDFVPSPDWNAYYFGAGDRRYAEDFLTRALWAGISVTGTMPATYGAVRFICSSTGGLIGCEIE